MITGFPAHEVILESIAVVRPAATCASRRALESMLLRALANLRGGVVSCRCAVEGQSLAVREQVPPVEGINAGSLTRREREVAALIARGYTNRLIAAELVIAERTAETHARNIRQKLGLATRAQTAAWAADQGLLARVAESGNGAMTQANEWRRMR